MTVAIYRRILRASPLSTPEIRKSYEKAIAGLKISKKPELFEVPDSNSSLLVVRPLLGRAGIFLSKGAIAAINEEELRALLVFMTEISIKKNLILENFFGLIRIFLEKLVQENDLKSYSAFTFFRMILFSPFLRFFALLNTRVEFCSHLDNFPLQSALLKIRKSNSNQEVRLGSIPSKPLLL